MGGITDLQEALKIGEKAGLNALKACAKNRSVKRFVNTSSSLAVTFPKPREDHDVLVDKHSYNDEALKIAEFDESPMKGLFVYAAMKTETEKQMWKWVEENKPGFVMNTIV